MSNIINTGGGSLAGQASFVDQLKEALEVRVKSRPYTAQISRETPSALVFLLDQSGSMTGEIYDSVLGKNVSKADKLTEAVNKILNDLLDRCKKSEGYRDYFDIAIIGYGGEDSNKANFAWQGNLKDKRWVKVSELVDNYVSKETISIEQNIRGKIVYADTVYLKWIEPKAVFRTPMNSAMLLALDLLQEWIVNHKGKDVYPPTIINITDGQLTDATFEEVLKTAQRIKQLHTIDGNVLVFNLHIAESDDTSVLFPQGKDELPNDMFAGLLFDMSSDLPSIYDIEVSALTNKDKNGTYTGMSYNANLSEVVRIMDIGTRTSFGRILKQ
jgi:uncharacterized protein YegL